LKDLGPAVGDILPSLLPEGLQFRQVQVIDLLHESRLKTVTSIDQQELDAIVRSCMGGKFVDYLAQKPCLTAYRKTLILRGRFEQIPLPGIRLFWADQGHPACPHLLSTEGYNAPRGESSVHGFRARVGQLCFERGPPSKITAGKLLEVSKTPSRNPIAQRRPRKFHPSTAHFTSPLTDSATLFRQLLGLQHSPCR
jgi:hypothetical protein